MISLSFLHVFSFVVRLQCHSWPYPWSSSSEGVLASTTSFRLQQRRRKFQLLLSSWTRADVKAYHYRHPRRPLGEVLYVWNWSSLPCFPYRYQGFFRTRIGKRQWRRTILAIRSVQRRTYPWYRSFSTRTYAVFHFQREVQVPFYPYRETLRTHFPCYPCHSFQLRRGVPYGHRRLFRRWDPTGRTRNNISKVRRIPSIPYRRNGSSSGRESHRPLGSHFRNDDFSDLRQFRDSNSHLRCETFYQRGLRGTLQLRFRPWRSGIYRWRPRHQWVRTLIYP